MLSVTMAAPQISTCFMDSAGVGVFAVVINEL